jgi:hypothetical protein
MLFKIILSIIINNELNLVFLGCSEVAFKQRMTGFLLFFGLPRQTNVTVSRSICGNKNAKGRSIGG